MDAPISTMGRVSISISDETKGYHPYIKFGDLSEEEWRKDCGLPLKISFGDFGPDDEGLNNEGPDVKSFNDEGPDVKSLNDEGLNGEGLNDEGPDKEGFNGESLNDEGLNDEGLNDEGLDVFACLDDKPPSEDEYDKFDCLDVYGDKEKPDPQEKVCPENHNCFLPQPELLSLRCVQCRGHQSLEFGGVIGGEEGFGFIRTTCQSCKHIAAYMTGVKCPNPHKNQGCLGVLWVNPDGTISPMCKNCHRCDGNRCSRGYDGCLGARWFNSKTRNLETYCVSCLHKSGPPKRKPTFKSLMAPKVAPKVATKTR
jgi:hypothetical protein